MKPVRKVPRWSTTSRCCPLGAKRRAIADDPLVHWDCPSACNRSRCRSASLREVIPFQIFSCFLSVIDINDAITCLYLYPLLLNTRPCGVCAHSSPTACSCTCTYRLPCNGDHREFSLKSTRKDHIYQLIAYMQSTIMLSASSTSKGLLSNFYYPITSVHLCISKRHTCHLYCSLFLALLTG